MFDSYIHFLSLDFPTFPNIGSFPTDTYCTIKYFNNNTLGELIDLSDSNKAHLSRIVRKRDYCLGENKGADQLRGNREADQRLCFRYTDSTFPLLLKSEISSFYLFSELVQAGLCRTWSEIPKTGFLASRLICHINSNV